MTMWKQRLAMTAVLCASMAFVGCGDDETIIGGEGNGSGDVTDAGGGDSDAGNPSIDAGDNTDTGSGDECTSNRDCAAGEECVEGVCQAAQQVNPCTAHLAACDSDQQTTDQFFCDVNDGLCKQRCDQTNVDSTGSSDCPLNSYCLIQLQGVSDGQLDGACEPGDCDTNIFDEDACNGEGTCFPFGNGASFCLDAGTALEGDPCGLDDSDNPPASDSCEPGLLCFLGECVAPCNLRNGDDDCGDETCIAVYDTTPRNQPGICGSTCEEFGTGCADGERCGPIFGGDAVNAWLCIDEGTDTVLGLGDDCSADDAVCGEGLLCLNQGSTDAPDLACVDLCDPLGEAAGPNAGCGTGGATGPTIGAELISETAFGEASDYLALDAGSYDVLVVADTAIVEEASVTAADGEINSLVYVWNDGALESFGLLDWATGDTLPTTGVRAVHASPDAGAVDIALVQDDTVINVAEGVEYQQATAAADDSSAYIELPAGDYVIRLTLEDDSTVDSPTITVADATLYTFVAGGSVTDATFGFFAFADDLAAPDAGEGWVRLIHMADQAPAVTVNLPAPAEDNGEVCAPLSIEGIGYCDQGCTPFPRLGPGNYECEEDNATCLPFVPREDIPVVPQGICSSDEGTSGPGGDCGDPGFLGGDCEDFAVCFGENEGDTTGTCFALCEPFGQNEECAEFNQACSGIPPLVGQQNFSFCTDPEPGNEGQIGERCSEEGISCAADNSICLDMTGSGDPRCLGVCRADEFGFDDCAVYDDDTQCVTGDLNPDVVPTYMGLCR